MNITEVNHSGFFTTGGVEVLESEIKAKPNDFPLRLKLAEIYAVHCKEIGRAEKVIEKMGMRFSGEQMELAKTKLKEWRGTVAARLVWTISVTPAHFEPADSRHKDSRVC